MSDPQAVITGVERRLRQYSAAGQRSKDHGVAGRHRQALDLFAWHQDEAAEYAAWALERVAQGPEARRRRSQARAGSFRAAPSERNRATQKQRAFLLTLGYLGPTTTKAEASRLINQLLAQRGGRGAMIQVQDRPTALPLQAGGIPDALRQREQFVAWRYELRDEKWTKVPLNPQTGTRADTSAPSSWGTLEVALLAVERYHADGVGYVFSGDDPFAGVDLDKCRNPATEMIEPWAAAIIAELNSYTEVSPSGSGVKIFLQGALLLQRSRKWKIEMYDRGRFFTLTGQHLEGTPAAVEERQEQLTAFQRRIFPPAAQDNNAVIVPGGNGLSDTDVLSCAFGAANGADFWALWSEPWMASERYHSQSDADFALVSRLVYWTGGDREQVDRLFRKSALMRSKWDERHRGDGRTYGQGTIDAALEKVDSFYPGKQSGGGLPRTFRLLTYEELALLPDPTWLVDGVLVENTLAAIVGEPASFKSFAALDLALSVATGEAWLGHRIRQHPVVYIAAEGSSGQKVRMAAWRQHHGVALADLGRFRVLPEAVQLLEDNDTAGLLAAIGALTESPGLIVVDTLARCFVGGEENSAKDMGRLVDSLDQLRRATGATVLLLHHVAKGSGTIRGSTALPGAMDTIIAAERKRGDHFVDLDCAKQKDAAEFPTLHLSSRTVELEGGLSSIVLELNATSTRGAPSIDARVLELLATLVRVFGEGGATAKDWAERSGLSPATFDRHRKTLVEAGLVEDTGGRRGVPYKPTALGLAKVSRDSHQADEAKGNDNG